MRCSSWYRAGKAASHGLCNNGKIPCDQSALRSLPQETAPASILPIPMTSPLLPNAAEPDWTSSGALEDLVAGAFEALDAGGEQALQHFLAPHPDRRDEVLMLVGQFRHTGLLVRDASGELPEYLGDFRLLRRLGGGGMGLVHLAEHRDHGRRVALKTIRPELLCLPGARERFRREIEVIARLEHPAIVPIVASGEHGGQPYYAMAYVDGCSSEEAVRRLRGRDPRSLVGRDLAVALGASELAPIFAGAYWEACVRLIRQVASGLAYAHSAGVVHRDVKPSNVMLTPDGRALLVDFGLALVRGGTRLTRAGAEPGSPAYMAPEQLRGAGAEERSDVYSLAATLWHLLALTGPFQADNAESLREQILLGQAVPLRRQGLPRELLVTLAVAMDVEPHRRYADMARFCVDLDNLLARRAIVARALPWSLRWLRAAQRHPWRAATVAAVLATSAMVMATWAWQQGRLVAVLTQSTAVAELHRDRAMAAVGEFLIGFGRSGLLELPSGQRLAGELFVHAAVLLDDLQVPAGDAEASLRRLQAEQSLATAWRHLGQDASARQRAEAVLAQWPATRTRRPEEALPLARLHLGLLTAAVGAGNAVAAREHAEAATHELATAGAVPELARSVVMVAAEIDSCLGVLAQASGNVADATACLHRGIDRLRGLATTADSVATLAMLHNRLGEVLREQQQFAAAAEQFAIVEQLLAPAVDRTLGRAVDLRLRAYAANGQARIAIGRGDLDEAKRCYERALPLSEAAVFAFPDDSGLVAALAGLLTEFGQVCSAQAGSIDAGLPLLERGRALFAVAAAGKGEDAELHRNRLVNLRTLCVWHVRARSAGQLAEVARELAVVAKSSRQHADAAWNLLLAADLSERGGHVDIAKTLDQEAVAALQQCERQGFFAELDLSLSLCDRLAGMPEFQRIREALRATKPAISR